MSCDDLCTTCTNLPTSYQDLVTNDKSFVRVSYDQGSGKCNTFGALQINVDAGSIFTLLEEEETLIFCTSGATLLARRRRGNRNIQETRVMQRRFWARPWLLRRLQFGHYERLMAELAAEDQEGFRNFQRIDLEIFRELLTRVGSRIEKQDTFMRKALSAGLRLAITLRFLATGDSYKSLEYNFRVTKNSICRIVPETCEAIVAELAPEVCRLPPTPAEWMSVGKGFAERWNFHNTIGALDGKHIAIRCPMNTDSVYYNYKGYHSVVLLALVDAEYRFLYVDVGSNVSNFFCIYICNHLPFIFRELRQSFTLMSPSAQLTPHEEQVKGFVTYLTTQLRQITQEQWFNFTVDTRKMVQSYINRGISSPSPIPAPLAQPPLQPQHDDTFHSTYQPSQRAFPSYGRMPPPAFPPRQQLPPPQMTTPPGSFHGYHAPSPSPSSMQLQQQQNPGPSGFQRSPSGFISQNSTNPLELPSSHHCRCCILVGCRQPKWEAMTV